MQVQQCLEGCEWLCGNVTARWRPQRVLVSGSVCTCEWCDSEGCEAVSSVRLRVGRTQAQSPRTYSMKSLTESPPPQRAGRGGAERSPAAGTKARPASRGGGLGGRGGDVTPLAGWPAQKRFRLEDPSPPGPPGPPDAQTLTALCETHACAADLLADPESPVPAFPQHNTRGVLCVPVPLPPSHRHRDPWLRDTPAPGTPEP